MKDFSRNFELSLNNSFKHKDKCKQYFMTYNFEQVQDDENGLVFEKKGSWLISWIINPLNWKSKITIKLSENKVVINHRVVSNGFLTPIAFTTFFKSFLFNLQNFLNQNIEFKNENSKQIKLAKKRVLKFHVVMLMGVLLGSFLGVVLSKYTGIKSFSIVGVLIVAITTEKIINQYLIQINTT